MNPKRIVIIGGGISGLVTAYRLSELSQKLSQPMQITVLEASERFGGVIRTKKRDGFLIEEGPDSFMTDKPWMLDLCRRISVDHELIETKADNRRGYLYRRGEMFEIPEGLYMFAPVRFSTLLRLPFLSWSGKIRMAFECLVKPKRDGDDESIGEFVRRRFGHEALEQIAKPMIGSICNGDINRISLQSLLPQFREMEIQYGSLSKAFYFMKQKRERQARDRSSGPRYSLFLSLKNGMESLIDRLIDVMPGVSFYANAPVDRIQSGDHWQVQLKDGACHEADAICIATSSAAASKLLKPVAPDLSEDLGLIENGSVATVNLAFKRTDLPSELGGFGFVVSPSDNRKLLSGTFVSNKFSDRAPEDSVLIRVFVNANEHKSLLELDDLDLKQVVVQELKTILKINARPLFVSIARHWKAMPQYRVGHADLISRIHGCLKKYPDLFLSGNAYQGVGLPACVHQAEQVAERIYERSMVQDPYMSEYAI